MPLHVALAGSLGSNVIGSGSGSFGSRTCTAAALASASAATGTAVTKALAAATPSISSLPLLTSNLPRFSCQPDPRACTTRKISFSQSPRPRAVAEIAATAQLRRLPAVAAAAASAAAAAAAFTASAGPAAAQAAAPGATLAAAAAVAAAAATASLWRARGRLQRPTNASGIRGSSNSGSSSSTSISIGLAGRARGNPRVLLEGGLLGTFPATSRHTGSPGNPLPRSFCSSLAQSKTFRCNMSTSDMSASDPGLRPVGGSAGGAGGERGSKEQQQPQQQQQSLEGAAAAKQHKHTNRLANEQSPYLLQHAHNPVDWYPWGEEAFAKARAEDKLVFLSVGYSTCHWCHVMEVESFESEEIAAIMNRFFVNIKVDREERPDVDKVYMTYVQATQGGGGWPMSVFLTPSLHPVLGATYFPPEDRYGRPGFKTVLQRVAKVWSERRDDLERGGREAMEQLAEATAQESTSTSASASSSSSAAAAAAGGGVGGGAVGHILEPSLPQRSLQLCFTQLASRFDERRGGFGSAPKFPRPSELTALLWRFYRGNQQPDEGGVGEGAKAGDRALHMTTFTLEAMARGGMHDHVGGGFHRYSVDDYWHVPHFEKMLYDQGQLANAYLEGFAATADVRFAVLARDVLDYVLRGLTHPDGGFYSAEDADSLDLEEGKKREGAFYVWKEEEIDDVLGGAESDRCRLFKSHYYVKGQGNCDLSPMSDPHAEFVGKNCLIERSSLDETAKKFGIPVGEAARILGQCRKDLHAARAKRPRPHLDDKVIVAWNGLMISAFARASRVLKSEPKYGVEYHFPVTGCAAEEYLAAAANAASFIRTNLFDPATGRLKRSFREGPSKSPGFADDYAFLVSGLLDLFEASGDTQWLAWATRLQDSMDELMWDDVGGGYYNNAEGDASILLRMKEDYDGAEPSPNSYAMSNLVRLAGYVGGERGNKYSTAAARTAAAFRDRLAKAPLALPHMCAAVQLLPGEEKLRQVVIAGAMGSEERERLHDSAFATFCPDKLVIALDPASDADRTFWETMNKLPLAMALPKTMATLTEQTKVAAATSAAAAAYVCQNFTCLAPTSDPDRLKQLLAPSRASPNVTKVKM